MSPCRAFLGPDGPPRLEPADGGSAPPPMEGGGWRAVADLARRAEAVAGSPQDIEWALDGEGRLWLLQCRPITAMGAPAADAPAGVWTRALAVDLWADRLTPFLAAAMLESAPRWDQSAAAGAVGLPVVRPTLAVIGGFLYVNAESLRSALGVLPRRLRPARTGDLLPPGVTLDDLPAPAARRLAGIAARAALFALRNPGTTPLFCRAVTRRRMRRLASEVAAAAALPSAATPEEALARVQGAADLLARHQEANGWGYTWATALTWAFRHLVASGREGGEAGFLQLLGEGADNVSLEMEREFRRLADLARADGALSRRVAAEGPAALLDAGGAFRDRLDRFLHRFGCRARGRSLSCPRWAEAPEEAAAMVAGLMGRGDRPAVDEGRAEAARAAWARVPPLRRPLLRGLQRFARSYLDLREELRFHLDGALYLLRRSLLRSWAPATMPGEAHERVLAQALQRDAATVHPPPKMHGGLQVVARGLHRVALADQMLSEVSDAGLEAPAGAHTGERFCYVLDVLACHG